ncbi:MAG: AMP-binding protein, partial [Catenulispora sp.]|nr:AMP-binding protein [Catenulispora sp.]
MTLDEAVATLRPLPAELTIPDLLDAAAWAYGSAPALRTMAGTVLTHRELADRTRVLAAQLASTGVGPGVPVAVLVDHEPAAIQAIIAIVRAGGCCVRLDPRRTVSQNADLVAASRVTRLVVGPGFRRAGSEIAASVPTVRLLLATPGLPSPTNSDSPQAWDTLPRSPVIAPSPSDLAYVGTAGNVRHQNLVDLLSWLNRSKQTTHKDLVLQAAPLALDVALHDIFGTLAAGGSVL